MRQFCRCCSAIFFWLKLDEIYRLKVESAGDFDARTVIADHECQSLLRPDVVLFGEAVAAEPEWLSQRALSECDLFLAVGTSGLVSPACDFVRSAKYVGARTILVNLEPMGTRNAAFDQELLGPAEEILPTLLAMAL